jgi:RHH-type proline utilization regulon transcriptional repressor/proline dehydrogenase/delta 1-pyrroline-5-carboxylate dehydrogenase
MFEKIIKTNNQYRAIIRQFYTKDENETVNLLLNHVMFAAEVQKNIQNRTTSLIQGIRQQQKQRNTLDEFLSEYHLSTEEGIAMMCLAEALLRIPDKVTQDKLIQDKICSVNWQQHAGKSESFFVNAATWVLTLTNQCIAEPHQYSNFVSKTFKHFIKNTSAPIIRACIMRAMKILGEQFVMGETIESAINRAKTLEKIGYRYSYDMLGESARTQRDSEFYFTAYSNAIQTVGGAFQGKPLVSSASISIKLSALFPGYAFSKYERVVSAVTEKLLALAQSAKKHNIALTIDAEDASVLEMSLDILENVFIHESLQDWEGLGLAIQAYQKRCFYLLDWLIDLARRYKKRWMVRLVKGAYWDSEIKMAQVAGLSSYPVFTRKESTDVSYLACAQKMLAARDALYCMFATHNAYSAAAIMELAGEKTDYEFQCLHGMGNLLYHQIVAGTSPLVGEEATRSVAGEGHSCRIYAPVGSHRELLPYLVRRLLENGANTSFVHKIRDIHAPIEALIQHPVDYVTALENKMNTNIPSPENLFAPRKNSAGINLTDPITLEKLATELEKNIAKELMASAIVAGKEKIHAYQNLYSPANQKIVVGKFSESSLQDVEEALQVAHTAARSWDMTPVEKRAECVEKMADLLEQNIYELMAVLIREAGKILADAVAEIREAVDFCRYYAAQARVQFQPQILPGPTGEYNELSLHGRGVVLCISPWNFPLAIFLGQIAAALVAGNTVIAKPAEQTPFIAFITTKLLYQAGIPHDVFHLLPGKGEVIGDALVKDSRIKAVIFTGSTDTARLINQHLAQRKGAIIPLIAETGGQNTMIVDSSALLDQVVVDVLSSAFGSAGQRCSALRVLFVQAEVKEKLIDMLKGAMAELVVGDPAQLATEVGPVIDEAALKMLQNHFIRMQQHPQATLLYQVKLSVICDEGHFFPPCAFEIESLDILDGEIFGPFLHIIPFQSGEIDAIIAQISSTGYGLTQGIHSRINHSIDYMRERLPVGNLYVNRNMIGAVVGVQPFGGEGLSGTGPKAGGPHYLYRLAVERTLTINTTAAGGNAALLMTS